MSSDPQPLLNVKEDERFLGDKRDLESALIHARPFGQSPEFKDRAEASAASDALKGLKDLVKAAEENRKAMKAPYKMTGDSIDGHYKELLSVPKSAIQALDAKGVRFRQRERREQDEERKAEEARLAKGAEVAAEKAAATARQAEAEPQNAEAQEAAALAHREAAAAAVATPTEKVQPKQLRGDVSSFGTTTTYEWEVTDLKALPGKHITFNKKTIDVAVKAEKAMAKAQGREFNLQCIPGVRIWPKERGVSRRSG